MRGCESQDGCHTHSFAPAEVPPIGNDGTVSSTFEESVDYESYFTSKRLRVDFVLAGDAARQQAFLLELHRECDWSGSPNSLIDYYVK